LDTVLGLRPGLSENAEARRRSLGLIIEFLRAAGGCESSFSPESDFLVACYARALPNGDPWSLTAQQAKIAELWGFYFREELLSLATQRLFREALVAIDVRSPPLSNVEVAGQWCASSEPFVQIVRKHKTYDALLASVKENLARLANIHDENHEVQLWEKVTNASEEAPSAVAAAIELVLTLVLRKELASYSIQQVIGANSIRLHNYPINIDAVAARARDQWPGMAMTAWVTHLLSWMMATHRQVALRKLSQTGDDTRRLRMGENTLYVDGTIDVARTVPRLRPALRFLHDLGLTKAAKSGHLPIPTQEAITSTRYSNVD
jgi:hypothetical protein